MTQEVQGGLPSQFIAVVRRDDGEIVVGGQGIENVDPESLVLWLKIATAKLELLNHTQLVAAVQAQSDSGIIRLS